MTAITFTGTKPTVGGNADTWGVTLNTGIDQIKADLEMLNASPANRILGRNDGTTGEVERLTGAEVTAMLDAMAGATQSTGGTQGVVPTPLATQQNRVLGGDGTWRIGLGRAAGASITTTNVNGSQPTFAGALNIASLSTLTVVGAQSSCTVTFTNALPSATFQILATGNGNIANAGISYGSKSTSGFTLYWDNTAGNMTQIDVSVFAG